VLFDQVQWLSLLQMELLLNTINIFKKAGDRIKEIGTKNRL